MSLVIHPNVDLEVDEEMGRCLTSSNNFVPGQVLFTETSFLFSSYDGGLNQHVEFLAEAFPKSIINNLEEILDDLSSFDHVQSLDTAKNFILLLALDVLRRNGKNATIESYFNKLGLPRTDIPQYFILLDQLTAANLETCVEDVKQFRKSYPKLIPKAFSNEDGARLLGILNTNQLELEDLGGSGLFVKTAIIQHDCQPSCSFTTSRNTLYLTAIRGISAGQRISIDYGNNFYRPTQERQESLLETYGFRCKCGMCTDLDLTRQFRCSSCAKDSLCPTGTGEDTTRGWKCLSCGARAPKDHVEVCLAKEDELKSNQLDSLGAIRSAIEEGILSEGHYLFFWALNDISMSLTAEARSSYFSTSDSGPSSQELYMQAREALVWAVRLLERRLPPVHHEKVVYYDRLGQLCVATGDAEAARTAFRTAYESSILASGAAVPATLQLHKLATNTPATVAELLEHYRNIAVDEMASEGNDEVECEYVEGDAEG